MNFLKYIKKGRARRQEPAPLRIAGVSTVLTPQPDGDETAAHALLDSMADRAGGRRRTGGGKNTDAGTPEYYHRLSERIRDSHAAEARLALRFVAFCERELETAGPDGLAELESGLYLHQASAEREGGELLRRWRRCLAFVIVRQMDAASGGETD